MHMPRDERTHAAPSRHAGGEQHAPDRRCSVSPPARHDEVFNFEFTPPRRPPRAACTLGTPIRAMPAARALAALLLGACGLMERPQAGAPGSTPAAGALAGLPCAAPCAARLRLRGGGGDAGDDEIGKEVRSIFSQARPNSSWQAATASQVRVRVRVRVRACGSGGRQDRSAPCLPVLVRRQSSVTAPHARRARATRRKRRARTTTTRGRPQLAFNLSIALAACGKCWTSSSARRPLPWKRGPESGSSSKHAGRSIWRARLAAGCSESLLLTWACLPTPRRSALSVYCDMWSHCSCTHKRAFMYFHIHAHGVEVFDEKDEVLQCINHIYIRMYIDIHIHMHSHIQHLHVYL